MDQETLSRDDIVDFNWVVESYADFVYNVDFRLMCDPEDAEQVTFATFLSAQGGAGEVTEADRVALWLYRITTSVALNKMRSKSDHSPSDYDYAGGLPADDGCQVVCHLDPELRIAVVLKDVEGLTSIEAAEVLDVSLQEFRSRLHKARIALQKILGEQKQGGGFVG